MTGIQTAEELKRAYRAMVMRYHPDRNPNNAEALGKMQELNEAYAVLSDPDKRQVCDLYGHEGLSGYTQEDIPMGIDFLDVFNEFDCCCTWRYRNDTGFRR